MALNPTANREANTSNPMMSQKASVFSSDPCIPTDGSPDEELCPFKRNAQFELLKIVNMLGSSEHLYFVKSELNEFVKPNFLDNMKPPLTERE